MPLYPPASGGGGSGTVTSIATTTPIAGGTITGTGTLSLAASLCSAPQALTSPGAVNVTAHRTAITSDNSGGVSLCTLADGTYTGQRKSITLSVLVDPGDTVRVTPAHMTNATFFSLQALLASVELEWDGAGWDVVMKSTSVAITV